jgi:hypothetical protein
VNPLRHQLLNINSKENPSWKAKRTSTQIKSGSTNKKKKKCGLFIGTAHVHQKKQKTMKIQITKKREEVPALC